MNIINVRKMNIININIDIDFVILSHLNTIQDWKNYAEVKPLVKQTNYFWSQIKNRFNPSVYVLSILDWSDALHFLSFDPVTFIFCLADLPMFTSEYFLDVLLSKKCFIDAISTKKEETIILPDHLVNHLEDDKICFLDTFLLKQCRNNNTKLVKFLLERGANPNVIDYFGCSPLSVCNSTHIANLLCKHGAIINPDRNPLFPIKPMFEHCALLEQVRAKNINIVKLLLHKKPLI